MSEKKKSASPLAESAGSAFALRRKGHQLPLDAFYATEREAEMAKGWQQVPREELETLKVTYEVLPNDQAEPSARSKGTI